jgi:hypothetical protein
MYWPGQLLGRASLISGELQAGGNSVCLCLMGVLLWRTANLLRLEPCPMYPMYLAGRYGNPLSRLSWLKLMSKAPRSGQHSYTFLICILSTSLTSVSIFCCCSKGIYLFGMDCALHTVQKVHELCLFSSEIQKKLFFLFSKAYLFFKHVIVQRRCMYILNYTNLPGMSILYFAY